MTVQLQVVSSSQPHIGLPDWKLKERQRRADPASDERRHRSHSRRMAERRERRESSKHTSTIHTRSSSFDRQERERERDRYRERRRQQERLSQQPKPEHVPTSIRRTGRSDRTSRISVPQHEIEFLKESAIKKSNASSKQFESPDKALFTFPWKWPGVDAQQEQPPMPITSTARDHAPVQQQQQQQQQHRKRDIGTPTKTTRAKGLNTATATTTGIASEADRGKGVPSVVFAIRDNASENNTALSRSVTASSALPSIPTGIIPEPGRTHHRNITVTASPALPSIPTGTDIIHPSHSHNEPGRTHQRIKAPTPTRRPIAPPRIRRQTHQEPAIQPWPTPPSHLKRQEHQRKHQHRLRRLLPDDESSNDLQPIAPKPQVPILVGGREDPIPCSDSLMDSVHRRYASAGIDSGVGAVASGESNGVKPHHHHRKLKKQTIHDLTGLESISTYELEQRYMVSEVQSILENDKKRTRDKEKIALPKLTHTSTAQAPVTDSDIANNQRLGTISNMPRTETPDPLSSKEKELKQEQKNRHSSPPGQIGGQIVYNLSHSSSQERQAKVHASIKAHTASISDSLEKMKFNLRQKQSLLSHAVFDMKTRQKREEKSSITDRLRNNLNVSQRNPDTVPLLKNQNYISDIFSDIASKMTVNKSRGSERHNKDNDEIKAAGSRQKYPYIPKVSGILQARREQERAKEASKLGNSRDRAKPQDDGQERQARAPQKKMIDPSLESLYRKNPPPQDKPKVEQDITSIHLQDPCSITSPITEQFSTFMTPDDAERKQSSLYLPNIRSRRTTTPVGETKLPFRPTNSTPKELFGGPASRAGGGSSRYPSVRDVIDVTSAASSLRFKNVIDVTDQASSQELDRDPSLRDRNQQQQLQQHHRHHHHQQQQQHGYQHKQQQRQGHKEREHRRVKQEYQQEPKSKRTVAGDVIDVTSLASSNLSQTTVKKVICVDEDSKGYIRTKRKLSAMPKLKKYDRSKGPPPTRSTGQRRIGAQDVQGRRQNEDRNLDDDTGVEIHYEANYEANYEAQYKSNYEQANYRQTEEQPLQADYRYSKNRYTREREAKRNSFRDEEQDVGFVPGKGSEEEIVFAPSPTAKQGLFEGIWDAESPGDLEPGFLKELPKRSLPVGPPKVWSRDRQESLKSRNNSVDSSQPPASFSAKGPLFMSRYSQENNPGSKKLGSHLLPRTFPTRYPLQPEAEEDIAQTRSPLEASATGPEVERESPQLLRTSSRLAPSLTPAPLARGPSPLGRATDRVSRSSSPVGKGKSPLGRNPGRLVRSGSPLARAPSRLAISVSPTIVKTTPSNDLAPPVPQSTTSPPAATRSINRVREPSVLPWATRNYPSLIRRQDAPINAGNKTPIEPEGSVNGIPDAKESTDEPEESSSSEETKKGHSPQIVRPKPVRRASALSKKEKGSERSNETRSVTFKEAKLRGQKDGSIPNYICTDMSSTEISWKRNKSVRSTTHPWDKESPSQSSSRKAFTDLSTRKFDYSNDDEKRRRRVDAFEKATSQRDEEEGQGRKGGKSSKRSMYDEVLDATVRPREVIILDDEGSMQYEVYHADRDTGSKEKLWDEVSNSLNQSYTSHGRHWETLGDGSIRSRHIQEGGSNARSSRRSGKRDLTRERDNRENGFLFDFLCF
ncbi:expressed unknown protein [Seminavis robusta]|uniref:Uncharacterized protein n=1 Tax=Seminavis robusta TaxID=568900 RepID=A0A9N8EDJ1_9STRA|nr:expressed unknown protein [Seminavis robusta]|eukprot:Sro993_g228900.1 n/a (1638) ;mRNA; r:4468-9381